MLKRFTTTATSVAAAAATVGGVAPLTAPAPVSLLPPPPQQFQQLQQCSCHQKRFFSGEMRHHNTEYNNLRIPWDFSQESYKKIDQILAKFPRSRRKSGVIPLLHLAQVQNGGWIPVTAMYKIARICEVSPMEVFQTVTFYAMFNRKPVGKYHIQFCVTTPCMLRGCDDLIHRTEKYLNIPMFGTTHDGLFTIGEMECMGCCVNAPMVVVSDYSNPPNFSYNFYEDLDWDSMKNLINSLREGKPLRVGSQRRDRKWSEPAGGKTTLLFKEPPGPYCRDLDPPKADAAASAKK